MDCSLTFRSSVDFIINVRFLYNFKDIMHMPTFFSIWHSKKILVLNSGLTAAVAMHYNYFLHYAFSISRSEFSQTLGTEFLHRSYELQISRAPISGIYGKYSRIFFVDLRTIVERKFNWAN